MAKHPTDQPVPSDDRFETVANASVDGLLVIDDDGVVQFANPAAVAMFAEQAENLVGFHFGTPAVQESTELQLPGKGEILYVEMRASEFSWNGREATLASLRDITDRKQAEEALRENEKKYRSLVEGLNDAVYRMKIPEGRYEYFSSSAEEVFGYASEDFFNNPSLIKSIIHPDSAGYFEDKWEELLEGNIPEKYEYKIIDSEGNERWIVQSNKAIFDDTGQIKAIEGLCQNVTERKRAEEVLRASEEKFRSIFASMSEIVVLHELVCDEDDRPVNYRLLDCNPAFTRITGIRREDAVDRLATDVYGSNSAPYLDKYARVALTGEPCAFITAHAPMGKHFDIHVASPGKNMFVTVTTDITERKQSEQALAESEKRFRNYFENLSAGSCIDEIVYKDGRAVDYRILTVNPAYEQIMGIARSKVVGALGSQVYGLNEAPFLDKLERVAETGEPERFEAFFEPIGKHLDFTVSRPSPGMFSTVFFDITERKQAEERLAVSEEKFRLAFMTSPDSININRFTDGLFLEINEGFQHIMGYTREELIGRTSTELNIWKNPEDRKRLMDGLQTDGYVQNLSAQFCGADGTIREGLMSACMIELKGEQCILSITRDITARKQAERRVQESEARLSLATQAAGIGIWDRDIVNNVLTWDDRMFEIYGVKQDAFGGAYEAWQQGVHPEDLARTVAEVDAAERGEKAFDTEFRIVRPDGEVRHIKAHAQVLRDEAGTPVRMVGVNYDITARKAAQAAKAEQQGLLEAIYRNAPLIIMVVDNERRIQQINGFASQFADRSNEEMLGLRGGEALRCLHALEDPQGCGFGDFCEECTIRNTVFDTLQNGTTNLQVEADYYLFAADGRSRAMQLLVSSTPLIFNGEHMALVTMMDISERKQLEAKLHQAQKMESVGRLAGGVAHDFNNLLMGIMGHADLCKDMVGTDSEARVWLDEITNVAERSANLTRQLLAFARKQTIAPKIVDLNDAVSGMLKLLRRLIGEDIDLSWQPGSGSCLICIDPGQVDQILANLCVNARDALSGGGQLTIETANAVIDDEYCADHVEATAGRYVMLGVSDNGCGMDDETLEHVFEPFFTTKPTGEGTGLGLATVYGIVKQNNGFVNVYSEPEKGTTFRIYLPCCGEQETIEVTDTVATHATANETILIAEDEKSIRTILKRQLDKLGYTIITAAAPEEALRLADEWEGAIDLLITDVVMPGMSGRDLAEKLISENPGMKVLYMSGYTANVIAHRGILEDNVEFLSKPFTRDDLARKIRELLTPRPRQ